MTLYCYKYVPLSGIEWYSILLYVSITQWDRMGLNIATSTVSTTQWDRMGLYIATSKYHSVGHEWDSKLLQVSSTHWGQDTRK
jgi:hypothetical protein